MQLYKQPACSSVALLLLVASTGCLLSVCLIVGAFPSGAPDSACKDLKPGHGGEAQSGSAPYELTQDKAEAAAGDQIKVTLGSASKTTFKGLLVQAVDDKVTHSDKEPKKTATLVWEAPSSFKNKQPVTFKATVVHKFDQFYMNIKSTVARRR